MSHLLRHLRANAIAYLALFVALGGTSYAAIGDPIGAAQIKNHVIQPVKFDPHLIGGYVRAWAAVDPNGRVLEGPGQPRVHPSNVAGGYAVSWRKIRLPKRPCGAIATVIGPGYAGAGETPKSVGLTTYNPQGNPTPMPFYVVVVC